MFAFNGTILVGGMSASETVLYPKVGKVFGEWYVFPPIVGLNGFKLNVVLGFDELMKLSKGGEGIRFVFKEINPRVFGASIHKGHIV